MSSPSLYVVFFLSRSPFAFFLPVLLGSMCFPIHPCYVSTILISQNVYTGLLCLTLPHTSHSPSLLYLPHTLLWLSSSLSHPVYPSMPLPPSLTLSLSLSLSLHHSISLSPFSRSLSSIRHTVQWVAGSDLSVCNMQA